MRYRKRLFIIICGLFFYALLEGGSYLTCLFLVKKGILYDPKTITESYDIYISRLSPQLGWPSATSFGKYDFDQSGSRIIPAFPDPDKFDSCISIYGDSFIWGADVDNDNAWGNIFSKKVNCRVANYGIGGYGTDQSYLRFKYNKQDHSKIVIIGFSSDDIRRNVNQLRNLFVPSEQFGIKPRFIMTEENCLKLVPIPDLTKEDYQSLIKNPERYLPHDYFVSEGLSGRLNLEFPYSVRILKLSRLLLFRIISGNPGYEEFYQPDHESKALQVTTAIIENFYHEAKAKGKYPLVLLIPILPDIIKFKKTKIWVYQTLMDNLVKSNIEFLNVGQGIISSLNKRDPQSIYTQGGHFNKEGSELMANYVFEYLISQKIIGGDARPAVLKR
jgi:lysophospholipase L1-like esterase